MTKEQDAHLNTLEVYIFANCANQTPDTYVHYLENISDQCDTVAWLGALFPFPKFWKDSDGTPINISGPKKTRSESWGHFLNSHYLVDNMSYLDDIDSRLCHFLNGKVPPPPPAAIAGVPPPPAIGTVPTSAAIIGTVPMPTPAAIGSADAPIGSAN
jgi:hypothetical protein